MSGSEDQSEWQRAYDASIAEQVARAQAAAAELDPARRWAIEFRAGFSIFITLLGFAGLGVGLLVSGPWYVSVVGVLLLLPACVGLYAALQAKPWKLP